MMGLLRLTRHRPVVLLVGKVMIAASNITGDGCRVGTPGGLGMTKVFERLGIRSEESIEHTAAIVHHGVLWCGHIVGSVMAHIVTHAWVSQGNVVDIEHHGGTAGGMEAG